MEQLSSLVNRLESAVSRMESQGGGGGQMQQQSVSKSKNPVPVMEEVEFQLKRFKGAMVKQPQVLQEISAVALQVLDVMFKVYAASYNYKKPSKETQQAVIDKIRSLISKLDHKKNKAYHPRKFKHTKQLQTIKKGLDACYWVVSPSPLVQIQGGTEAVNFNAYKCTKDLPKEDRVWLLSYGFIFKKMQAYVKQNLAGGLKWQYQGEEYTFGEGKQQEQVKQVTPQQTSNTGGMPPPPPPGPPPKIEFNQKPSEGNEEVSGANDLFAEIASLRDNATSVLGKTKRKKKGVKQDKLKKKVVAKQNKAKQKKPPRRECVNYGKDWFIENYENDQTLELREEEDGLHKGQKLFICNCDNCLIKVGAKINMISIQNCNKTNLVFESVISQVEIVDSKKLRIQQNGTCPSYMIDQCQSVFVYLPQPDATEVVSSFSSELQLSYKVVEEDDYSDLQPIPAQFMTKWDEAQKKFVTEAYDEYM